MAITEAQRFEMHLELKKTLGDDVANILMEHLPPAGWGDVARRQDLDASVALVRGDLDSLRREVGSLSRDMARLDRRLGMTITVGVGVALAIIAIQMQIMLSIAHL